MEFLNVDNMIPNLIWCGSCLYAIQLRRELASKAGIDVSNHDESCRIARQEFAPAYFYLLMRVFGGGIMANLALGLSPLQSILIPSHLFCATLAWLTVFFCPGDYTYRFYMNNSFVYGYLQITNEIWRSIKIYHGIQIATQTKLVTDDSLRVFYYACIGTIKGNGADIFHVIKNFVAGENHVSIPATIKTSFAVALMLSVPFVLNSSINDIIFYTAITVFLGKQLLTIMTGEEHAGIANYLLIGVTVSAIIISILLNFKFWGTLIVSTNTLSN